MGAGAIRGGMLQQACAVATEQVKQPSFPAFAAEFNQVLENMGETLARLRNCAVTIHGLRPESQGSEKTQLQLTNAIDTYANLVRSFWVMAENLRSEVVEIERAHI